MPAKYDSEKVLKVFRLKSVDEVKYSVVEVKLEVPACNAVACSSSAIKEQSVRIFSTEDENVLETLICSWIQALLTELCIKHQVPAEQLKTCLCLSLYSVVRGERYKGVIQVECTEENIRASIDRKQRVKFNDCADWNKLETLIPKAENAAKHALTIGEFKEMREQANVTSLISIAIYA